MRAVLRDSNPGRYGGSIGASATINREPGQARKGAAEAVDLCAGVLLVESPPSYRCQTPRHFTLQNALHWGQTPNLFPC